MTNYALLSVYDKTNLVELGKFLESRYTILASGGTAKALRKAGVLVTDVVDYTQSAELFEGRVKTLHPKIYGGILAKATTEHQLIIQEYGIGVIDVVVCNLYPFEATVARTTDEAEIMENIDIGGPTLIRAAAKNFSRVTVLIDPNDYAEFMQKHDTMTEENRKIYAAKAFARAAEYDIAISKYFSQASNEYEYLYGKKVQELRYGENPHQRAAVYQSGQLLYEHLYGKEISYNNILDLLAGVQIVRDFATPACAIIKHRTPCGVATAATIQVAYVNALKGDKLSAYGGVYCFNRVVDEITAQKLVKMFIDTIIAPAYETAALDLLQQKKNILILRDTGVPLPSRDLHEIPNGFVIQDSDTRELQEGDWEVASAKQPSENELAALMFAWKVVKHSRSNAIVVAKESHTLGIGSGQTSRLDAAQQAITKAGEQTLGAVLASDAFFPFRDTIDEAAKAGIKAIISPKGSIRDQESIDAANEHRIVLVFTHYRAFKH